MPADIRFLTSDAPVRPSVKIALSVEGLVADAPDGTRLLDGVSFVATAGSMVAIAGPTGAGKTSLAAAITGAIPLTSGVVAVGGTDVSRAESSRRGIGYVAQEDALHGELSVRQTLGYAAELRLPRSAPGDRRSRIDSVLDETRLAPQADAKIESLSVGQRKRVSIALELLSQPDVLILDEPTSSLDPGYEATVMTTLRRLADLGQCVVVVTHSQQVIADCDQVAVLASGGGLAYFGPTARMHDYFGSSSPAELFNLLDAAPDSLYIPKPAVAVRPMSGRTRLPVVRPSARQQFSTLTRRYARVTFSDRRRTALFAMQALVLGGLLLAFVTPAGLQRPRLAAGHATPLSATGMAVLLTTCVTWLGMSNSIREIVKERRILSREHRAGLSTRAYVASKLAVVGPLIAIQAVVVTAIAVRRQLVPATGAVVPSGTAELAIAMALAGLCAVTTAMLVSALVRTADKALAILPMIVVVEFVLSGLPPAVHMPGLSQLRDLAASRWAVQAIGATVTGDSHSWWNAIAALAGLSVAALVGTFVAAHRSLHTRTVRRRPSLLPAIARAASRFNPEMVRLVRVGGACLAAVVLVVTGARIAIPAGAAPVLAAAPVAAAPHSEAAPTPGALLAEMPGVVGNMFWLFQAGTTFGLDVTAAAYAASSAP
ncbi:MAG TPA: ATP-binding cassette domain-containing protein [Mycobacteriales bacterium]|nr:ATP-binding cassette domain-containing protein [Mycobacteriales bacterium]